MQDDTTIQNEDMTLTASVVSSRRGIVDRVSVRQSTTTMIVSECSIKTRHDSTSMLLMRVKFVSRYATSRKDNLGWSAPDVFKGREREKMCALEDQGYQASIYTHREDVPGAFDKDDIEGRMIDGHTIGDEIPADKRQTRTRKSWCLGRRPEFRYVPYIHHRRIVHGEKEAL